MKADIIYLDIHGDKVGDETIDDIPDEYNIVREFDVVKNQVRNRTHPPNSFRAHIIVTKGTTEVINKNFKLVAFKK